MVKNKQDHQIRNRTTNSGTGPPNAEQDHQMRTRNSFDHQNSISSFRAGPGIKGHLITFDRKRIEKKVDHINHSLSERSPKTS